MHTFTRYVLGQLLAVFALALGAITLIMLMFVIVRELNSQGLEFSQIAKLLPYILPDALRFAIPATSLFAVCLVFGRLSSANEVVALKALGISPWRILWPCFTAFTLLSFTAVWLNDLAVSWGRQGVQRIVLESIEEVAYSKLKNHGAHSTTQFSINVKGVKDRRLIGPTVTFKPSGDAPTVVIRAEWAELHSNLEDDTLTILMHNGSAVGGGFEGAFPGTITRVLPLSRASRKSQSRSRPSQLPLREIPSAVVNQKQRIESFEQELAATAAFQMVTGDFERLVGSSAARQDQVLASEHIQLHRLKTEPYRRWAAGFSCLFFVAVGAPLAIRRRYGEIWTTFFLCFMPILVVYYPLLMFSVEQAKIGALPPFSVWMGNVTLLIWSAVLVRRVTRY